MIKRNSLGAMLILLGVVSSATFMAPANTAYAQTEEEQATAEIIDQANDPDTDCGNADESFLGIPKWYRGLLDSNCEPTFSAEDLGKTNDTNPIWIFILNIIDALLRIAGLVAVIYVVVGGFKYTLSDGNPQKATEARQTIINALIGAVIAGVASGVVSFIVSRY